MAFEAAYLPPARVGGKGGESPAHERDPFHYGTEASRRARGVEVYAALRSLGRSGLAEMIEAGCRHARRFAEGLEAGGHVVLNEVVLNQVVVTFGAAERTARVIERIQDEGVCWCGPTHWKGQDAMRISVSCWATEAEDVERSLESILRCAASVPERGAANG